MRVTTHSERSPSDATIEGSGSQGNVRVVAAHASTVEQAPAPVVVPLSPEVAWSIRDGDGSILETDIVSRAVALRRLGCHASRGARLPIRVWTGGAPNGDRIG